MSDSRELKAVLILPTYNESENLPALVAAIRDLPPLIHIIVVDDNSPDGTGELAESLAGQHGNMKVIHRAGKLGLGTAYTAGFGQALADGADLVLTMDADFSHDPKYLPRMLEGARRHDLTIGSRYVPGGGVVNWGANRKFLSWAANSLAHVVLGLHARDCTAGFRCYHREVLEAVNPASIRANGYSYLIEMLYCCQQHGFHIGEIPIIFADRRRGQSKISEDEIFKAGKTVARLALRRLRRARRRLQSSLAAGRTPC